MQKTILVLGAGGNIGSALVDILRRRSVDFLAAELPEEAARLSREGINAEALEFDDPLGMEKIMAGADKLFMLVPFDERMVDWSYNILNAARIAGIRYIVRSSIIDADTASPYELFRVHGRIDQLVRSIKIPFTIIHPNSFMQNYIVYYGESIREQHRLYLAQGDAAVSLVDTRDIAAVAAQLLLNPGAHAGREYTLTGPEAVTNYDAARTISSAIGTTIEYIPLSDAQSRENMKKEGMSEWDIIHSMSVDQHITDGRSASVSHDVATVAGHAPRSFARFAHDYAHVWLRIPAGVSP